MYGVRQHNSQPPRSMRRAAWTFPVNLDGQQRQSWSEWANWWMFSLLLLAFCVPVGAFAARGPGVTRWERGALPAAGAAIFAILIRTVIGYRQLTASTQQNSRAPYMSAGR